MREYINIIIVMTSLVALEINNQNGIIPARTSQKITATAYPSRRVCYKFKLSYELFSMFGMLLNITSHSENTYLNLATLATLRQNLSGHCKEVACVRVECIDQHLRQHPFIEEMWLL